MADPGYSFMDSPGNDLESIAGQVAAGCNMIFFITGNGSITNFPFVPTVKFITTTGRWNLLSQDMDVNAGRYQDGEPMDELGEETFKYAVSIASGMASAGERAGHSQVSIWRDWRQTDGLQLNVLQHRPRPDGKPVPLPRARRSNAHFMALPTGRGYANDQVAMILPTSLCSGQIAIRIARELNAETFTAGRNLSRFVALPHTEGCGTSGGENEEHFIRTVIGHLLHPFVQQALLLEHGCEHTHNDLMCHALKARGVDPDRFGYASVQLDGGIDKVVEKVALWFEQHLTQEPPVERVEVGLDAFTIGLLSIGDIPVRAAQALANIAVTVAGTGGTVIVPENASLLMSAAFLEVLGLETAPRPSLDYGQVAEHAGLHIMATPTGHTVETLSGLGGTGVQLILAHVEGPPLQGHPMIPVVQLATCTKHEFLQDFDYLVNPETTGTKQIGAEILQLLCETASGNYQPRLWASGNTDFQLTRGLLGVSL
jgi:altronate dehydratase